MVEPACGSLPSGPPWWSPCGWDVRSATLLLTSVLRGHKTLGNTRPELVFGSVHTQFRSFCAVPQGPQCVRGTQCPPQTVQLEVHAPTKDRHNFKRHSIHHFYASIPKIFTGHVIFAQVGNQGSVKQRCLLHVSSGIVGKKHKNSLPDDWASQACWKSAFVELWVPFLYFPVTNHRRQVRLAPCFCFVLCP